MALPSQRRHPICLILDTICSPHLCVEESRRHNVHSGELAPLTRKAFTKMVHGGFRSVVHLEGLAWFLNLRIINLQVDQWEH